MIRLRAIEKIAIILAIILFTFGLPLKQTGLLSRKPAKKKMSMEQRTANETFEHYQNFIKESRTYNVENYSETVNKLREFKRNSWVVDRLSDINLGRNQSFFIAEYPDSMESIVYSFLDEMDGLTSESKVREGELNDFNYAEHIKNKKQGIEAIREKLNKKTLTSREIERFNKQLANLQVQVDSLNTKYASLNRERKYNLLYLTINQKIRSSDIYATKLKSYGRKVLINLAISIIALILINFIFIGIYKLMRVLGIQTKKNVSNRYGGYKGYGGYNYGGYGYGSQKRKVKRKYKSSSEEDNEDE